MKSKIDQASTTIDNAREAGQTYRRIESLVVREMRVIAHQRRRRNNSSRLVAVERHRRRQRKRRRNKIRARRRRFEKNSRLEASALPRRRRTSRKRRRRTRRRRRRRVKKMRRATKRRKSFGTNCRPRLSLRNPSRRRRSRRSSPKIAPTTFLRTRSFKRRDRTRNRAIGCARRDVDACTRPRGRASSVGARNRAKCECSNRAKRWTSNRLRNNSTAS